MKFCVDFVTNSRKERRVPLFQSNLRKQIRKLPKFLKFVKFIHYYLVFIIFHYYSFVSLVQRVPGHVGSRLELKVERFVPDINRPDRSIMAYFLLVSTFVYSNSKLERYFLTSNFVLTSFLRFENNLLKNLPFHFRVFSALVSAGFRCLLFTAEQLRSFRWSSPPSF